MISFMYVTSRWM